MREALVAWEHSVDYPLPTFKEFTSSGSGAGFQKTYELAKEHSFLCDHVVDGRILMPVRGVPSSLFSHPGSASMALNPLPVHCLSCNTS